MKVGALERSAVSLVKAQEHWHAKRSEHRDELTANWTIAISREAGSRGSEIAHELGACLNWPVYDSELVEKIAAEMGLRTRLLEAIDERNRSWIAECARGFASAPDLSETYVRRLIETVMALGTLGHCVIVGRGAAQILSPTSTLRVRLVAPVEDRIETVSRQLGWTHDEATQWVRKTTRSRIDFVKSHFLKDPSSMDQCDLILNSSRWSNLECADIIGKALNAAESRSASHGL